MTPDDAAPFEAAGPLRAAYDAVDWATTSLGPADTWGPTLRSTLDVMLHTRFPMTLFWGPEFVLIYNDAYAELIADKHPAALGTPAAEVFPEAWDTIGPMMQEAFSGTGTAWIEDASVPLHRRGFLEECYFTFSYSPVRGADGRVEGVLDIAAETTPHVLSARRQILLGHLLERLGGVRDLEALAEHACSVMRADVADLPVVDLHLPGIAPMSTAGAAALPPLPPEGSSGRRMVVATHDGATTVWLPLQRPAAGSDEAGERPVSLANGVMVVRCSDRLPFDAAYRVFLRLVAGAVATMVDRLATRNAELSATQREREFSTALQRSLLTTPAEPGDLVVAVRYEPATDGAQVGGDWHDSFVLSDGALALTVGDVAGHDRDAAAGMAQVRNLLRGIAYTMQEPPGVVMRALDRAMAGLGLDMIATAILARVEMLTSRDGERFVLKWSNAGHPPPALIGPGGGVELLDGPPDVLLGALPDGDRADHERVLEPGSMVVLYTDGLVDRRGQGIDEGFDWLVRTLAQHADRDPEELADLLLAAQPPDGDDDVAILVLRVP
jgi:serine phosphatase RsbU (regulator of sigma subunit)